MTQIHIHCLKIYFKICPKDCHVNSTMSYKVKVKVKVNVDLYSALS